MSWLICLELLKEIFSANGAIINVLTKFCPFCQLAAVIILDAPPPTTRERPLGCRTIFVGGLPEVVTEEALEEVFVNYGAITSVRKSKKKNFAHVRFEEEAAVERSLFLSGIIKILRNSDARIVTLKFEQCGFTID